ncbi:hypothetical protein [Chromobacterium alticapitis]|uniref:hypothetical protein n=1 Tax=Chromobacterium alticapitis TaxID=2073169 RepID=UPI001304D461|nr:hypothetical protein [Chromobacterium alticapitis]
MKTWILAVIAIGSLGGCVVAPPYVAPAPVAVRPVVVVPMAPVFVYGPHDRWR